jgi:hypothetical protein
MTIDELRNLLERAWDGETSASPDWTPANPSLGQCAITALVVRDWFDGELLRCPIPGNSHYWNRLPNGVEVDLTADQFDSPVDRVDIQTRTPEELLANPSTFERYRRLARGVEASRVG